VGPTGRLRLGERHRDEMGTSDASKPAGAHLSRRHFGEKFVSSLEMCAVRMVRFERGRLMHLGRNRVGGEVSGSGSRCLPKEWNR
jgi:hypothetical protein